MRRRAELGAAGAANPDNVCLPMRAAPARLLLCLALARGGLRWGRGAAGRRPRRKGPGVARSGDARAHRGRGRARRALVYVMGGFERGSGRRRPRPSATTSSATAGGAWRTCRSRSTTPPPRPTGATSTCSAAIAAARPQRGDRGALPLRPASADRWSRQPSAPTARGALAVGVIGHRLYAAGGANARDGALATLEIYDLRRRRWRAGPSMRVAREHLAGAVASGRFYALAGRAAARATSPSSRRYDPRRGAGGTCRRWASRAAASRRPRSRGRIVVVGGEEAAGTIREVELLDPRDRPLAQARGPADPAPRARSRVTPRPRLRDRGRRPTRLRVHQHDRGAQTPGDARRAVQISSTGHFGPTRRVIQACTVRLRVLGRVELVQAP